MEKKVNNKKIVKYAGAGLLAAAITTGVVIYDGCIEHEQEICPITRALNVIPNFAFPEMPTGIALHQLYQMESDLVDRGLDNVTVAYCPGNYSVTTGMEKVTVEPTMIKSEDGTVTYTIPAGYILKNDENGKLVGEAYEPIIENLTGLKATWGDIGYDVEKKDFVFEGETFLKTK